MGQFSFYFLTVVFVTCLTGCGASTGGKPTAHLAGSVTIGGEPLPSDAEGHIQFMPDTGGSAAPTSTRIVDGKFEADAVPMGEVTAIFHITRLTGRMVREDNAPGATPYPEREDLVPKKHRSGVKLTIEGDNDAHNFDL
mgnify:CR=1 FL=1